MGLFGNAFEHRWTHRCGGTAEPGGRCDWCDAKLKGSADATWSRPGGWTPPGEKAGDPQPSIW